MRVLVTGRRGQVAESLIERARRFPDVEMLALGRPELDLEMPKTLRAAIAAARPDVVVNAAAYTAVDRAEDEPERAFRVNADEAGAVAVAAREIGGSIIQLSTDYVFDGQQSAPYAEDAPTNPLGVYGRSKLAGEEQVRAANPKHLIVRTAWVYSPFGRNFVKTMLRLAETRDVVDVVADQRGSPTSAFDLADALLSILSRWQASEAIGLGETFHFCGAGTCSWSEFASEIFRISAEHGGPGATVRAISTADYPTKARRPANSALDCTKFANSFGFPIPGWRESLPSIVATLVDGRASHAGATDRCV